MFNFLSRIPVVGSLLGKQHDFSVTLSKRIAASPQQVWKAILAIEDYPQWQRAIVATKVLDRDPSQRPLLAQFELDAMVRTVSYTLRYTYVDPPVKVSWTSVQGTDIRRIYGEYTLHDVADDANACDLELRLEVTPGIPIPLHVRNALENTALYQALDDIERQAQNI